MGKFAFSPSESGRLPWHMLRVNSGHSDSSLFWPRYRYLCNRPERCVTYLKRSGSASALAHPRNSTTLDWLETYGGRIASAKSGVISRMRMIRGRLGRLRHRLGCPIYALQVDTDHFIGWGFDAAILERVRLRVHAIEIKWYTKLLRIVRTAVLGTQL